MSVQNRILAGQTFVANSAQPEIQTELGLTERAQLIAISESPVCKRC